MFEDFLNAYIGMALWLTYDDNGEPTHLYLIPPKLAPETRAKMLADCIKFYGQHSELFTEENCLRYCNSPETKAGTDLFLTRCGHGAGYWDGDWAEPAATILTDAAHAMGEVDLYVGDDGLIYLSP